MLSRRRRLHYEEESISETAVFITPFLDVSFQILIFFVFMYHPAALEGQFSISIAAGEVGGAPQPTTTPQPASPTVTEVRPTITVLARARPNGRLANLELLLAGQREDVRGAAGREDEPVEHLLAELEDKLWQYKKTNPGEQRLLLQVSPDLRWEETMRLLDSCKRPSVLYAVYKDATSKAETKASPFLINRYLFEGSEYRRHFDATAESNLKLFTVELDVLRPDGS
jgi:biopolymer transport protein ExbD